MGYDPPSSFIPFGAFYLQSWFREYPSAPNQGGFDPRDYFAARADERKKARTAVENAVGMASAALAKPECQKLFGTDQSRASGWDPAKTLTAIYSQNGAYIGGTSVYAGSEIFNNWPWLGTANTQPAVFSGGNTGGCSGIQS